MKPVSSNLHNKNLIIIRDPWRLIQKTYLSHLDCIEVQNKN